MEFTGDLYITRGTYWYIYSQKRLGYNMPPQNDLEYLINHAFSSEIMSTIGGNASLFIKEAAVRWYMMLDMRGSSSFGHSMRTRLELKEVSIEPSPDDSKKMSSKMVCDLEITPGECQKLLLFCVERS